MFKSLSKTAEYFYTICYFSFICGYPNFWIDDLKVSRWIFKFYSTLSQVLNVLQTCTIPLEWAAYCTQNNLSIKQQSDLLIYSISHPMLWSYSFSIRYQVQPIQRLIADIFKMQETFNDPLVETQMVSKAKFYTGCMGVSCLMSVLMHTVSAMMMVLTSEGTFTTLVTVWPLVDDQSQLAATARIVIAFIWWVSLTRLLGMFSIIICVTTALSHQYSHLQRYFYSLNKIFDGESTQEQKEQEYENGLVTGVNLHCDTLRCVQKCQQIFKILLGGQIIFVVLMLIILMYQMLKSERTMVNAFATAVTAMAVLFVSGIFVWNAGDITVEASKLDVAIFGSGWHLCQGRNTLKIRKLIVISMARAQKPVVLKGLGIMDLSYDFFLQLVKTSYSVFSVLV